MGEQHSAFFYGTLMAPPVLHRVCHGSSNPEHWLSQNELVVRPAILRNFRRHKVTGADYPAIIPTTDGEACVRGTFVTGLTDGDIWRLDIFEGDEYERRKVKVRMLEEVGSASGKGNVESKDEVEAETYVWINGEQHLEKKEWDFEEFVQQKMKRWVGVDGQGEYAEVDAAVRALGEDPTGGRGKNGSITKVLEEHHKSNLAVNAK